jgi:hypothetical protein
VVHRYFPGTQICVKFSAPRILATWPVISVSPGVSNRPSASTSVFVHEPTERLPEDVCAFKMEERLLEIIAIVKLGCRPYLSLS